MWGFDRHGYGMMGGGFFFARRLPSNLQRSDAQRTQIKSLMTAYRTAHQDDLRSIGAVMNQAHAAHVAGQSVSADQRRGMFAQTAPARQRLMSANKQLAGDIQKVLIPEQKSWLATHHPTLRRNTARARRSAWSDIVILRSEAPQDDIRSSSNTQPELAQ